MSVPFVGLTGGLGSGKSTALAALERLGARTISTDAVVHELYDSAEVVAAVRERLGEDVLDADGRVDRGRIAERVFADAEQRAWLERLLWPLVARRVVEFRAHTHGLDPPPVAAVVETPLLFEAGMEGAYDATIAVVARDELRAERARSRGHAAVDGREARQLSQEEKAARATYAVRNDGTEAELERALAAVLDRLAR